MGLFSTTNNIVAVQNSSRNITERVTEHVHEHRAPTDESVRLLIELEEKAFKNIIDKVHIQSNTVNALVIAYTSDALFNGVRWFVRFTLNDVKYEFDTCVKESELVKIYLESRVDHRRAMINFLKERFCEQVTIQIMKDSEKTFSQFLEFAV